MTRRPTQEQLTELAARVRLAIVPLAREMRQQANDPVTPTQLSVIGSISRHGPITLGELATRERLSPPMITKAVTALEDQGYVERIADPHDRRVVHVQLTRSGRAWLDDARARRNAWLAERLGRLSASERAVLANVLPLIERLAEEEPHP